MKKIFILVISVFVLIVIGLIILYNVFNTTSSPVSENGKLEVVNTDIVNQDGEIFNLKGFSSSRNSMDT